MLYTCVHMTCGQNFSEKWQWNRYRFDDFDVEITSIRYRFYAIQCAHFAMKKYKNWKFYNLKQGRDSANKIEKQLVFSFFLTVSTGNSIIASKDGSSVSTVYKTLNTSRSTVHSLSS